MPINSNITPSSEFWRGRRVLVTGHTGFKGSWLLCLLRRLGADVQGFALAPETVPNHYGLLNPDAVSTIGDIRDSEALKNAISEATPEIVFHLAAQPLVLRSYDKPIETFQTNVMGTLNLFEACRASSSVRAIVNVTSDKCYENREDGRAYKESDRMGGLDPYSASKGCSELLSASYRHSFFNIDEYGKSHETLLATARAGNVIGGGDWAEDRLIPDVMRAAAAKKTALIRNPNAVRPWQHVLEPLAGYLLLGRKLLEGETECAAAWNFGPTDNAEMTVGNVANEMKKFWKSVNFIVEDESPSRHEASILRIDSTKAVEELPWSSVWNNAQAIEKTVEWYKAYYESGKLLTAKQIDEFLTLMTERDPNIFSTTDLH